MDYNLLRHCISCDWCKENGLLCTRNGLSVLKTNTQNFNLCDQCRYNNHPCNLDRSDYLVTPQEIPHFYSDTNKKRKAEGIEDRLDRLEALMTTMAGQINSLKQQIDANYARTTKEVISVSVAVNDLERNIDKSKSDTKDIHDKIRDRLDVVKTGLSNGLQMYELRSFNRTKCYTDGAALAILASEGNTLGERYHKYIEDMHPYYKDLHEPLVNHKYKRAPSESRSHTIVFGSEVMYNRLQEQLRQHSGDDKEPGEIQQVK